MENERNPKRKEILIILSTYGPFGLSIDLIVLRTFEIIGRSSIQMFPEVPAKFAFHPFSIKYRHPDMLA